MISTEKAFARIADDLRAEGVAVIHDAFPPDLLDPLRDAAQSLPVGEFSAAAIGRGDGRQQDVSVRGDSIHWLGGENPAAARFLDHMERLRVHLNRRLFLGLFDYEAHFARYDPGARYQRHLDAFHGRGDRRVSTVFYLNDDWPADAGGELLIYRGESAQVLHRVRPTGNTLVVFLSDEFPHEVLPASQTRWSIAGWFRVNNSDGRKVDPAS